MSNTYKTDIPCECGEHDLIITSDHVGFMGDAPCSEDWGTCPKCKKELKQHEINGRFKEHDL